MSKLLYLLLKRILWKLGYALHNKEISALPTRGNDPREVAYLDELPYTVQNFPLVTGTGLRYYGFTGRTYHPFVLALSQQTYGLSRQQFIYRLLKKYNELFSLTNANDFIGLAKEEEFFSSGSDPYHFTYPWSSLDPDEHQELISRTVLEENKRYGLNSSCSLELTNASDYKISIETRRLMNLMTKIKSVGFRNRSHDSLGCFVLLKEDQWRWYVHGGQHRAAVLAAMGVKEVPVRVRKIIRREEVDFWPQVQSGLFTRVQALIVFDKLFDAKLPQVAKRWIDYVDQTFYHADTNV